MELVEFFCETFACSFHYRLSLKIEPGNSSPRLATSKEDLAGKTSYVHLYELCSFNLHSNSVLFFYVFERSLSIRWYKMQ